MLINYDELKEIIKFVEDLEVDTTELEYRNSSGIGHVLSATVGYEVKGHKVKVTKEITGVDQW